MITKITDLGLRRSVMIAPLRTVQDLDRVLPFDANPSLYRLTGFLFLLVTNYKLVNFQI